ncbi:VOC family protein [Streptomyces phaeochromogenes]|uniref:VOC family protein n=1 Tax=Streptomyces phaeochromogenes TaxID=1923 RepID=UPI002DDA754E|nr:VOC family protein [Streptomyces phaeochromogenes]WRZ34601.1 VOC family protein [Streptomyces phaeochromogenes]
MDILGIGYIGVESPNHREWTTFGPEVLGFGLAAAREGDESVYLRMDDRKYRIAIHPGETERVAYIGWEVANRPAFDAAIAKLEANDTEVTMGDEELAGRRAVLEVARFKDPVGYQHELFFGQRFASRSFVPGRPHGGFVADELGVGHMVLITPEYPPELDHFLSEVMGFRWFGQGFNGKRGQIGFYAAKLTTLSHSIAYIKVPGHRGLHHIGIGVNDLDDVGIANDLVLERGTGMVNSLGRHTQDPVISFYPITPSGFAFEYMNGGMTSDSWGLIGERNPERVSVWGHKPVSPGMPKSVLPVDSAAH